MKKAIFAVVLFTLAAQAMVMAQQVTDVNINTLLNDFHNNSARANQLYGNKTIRTSGTVDDITATGVWLYGDRMRFVVVQFNASERSKILALNKGQRITVRGTFTIRTAGSFATTYINNAVIETGAATTAQPRAQQQSQNQQQQALAHHERGNSFYAQGNWDSALAQYTEAYGLTLIMAPILHSITTAAAIHILTKAT